MADVASKHRKRENMKETVTVQNAPTPIEEVSGEVLVDSLESCNEVCNEVAENILKRVMDWQPLSDVATIATNMLDSKMRDATFFSDNYELTLKQKEYLRKIIASELTQAAQLAIQNKKNYHEEKEGMVEKTVIEEMMKIPEMTMCVIGRDLNRGALLAMTAVQAKSTNEDRDEILMWKSKTSGDITIPTRGVFISTNCIKKKKKSINSRDIDVDTDVK
jgi:hypothetical protein